jgi:hypothetical protein
MTITESLIAITLIGLAWVLYFAVIGFLIALGIRILKPILSFFARIAGL